MAWRLVAIAAAASMIGAAPSPKPTPAPAPQPGYLGARAPDTYKILPPAPVAGTTRYEADRTVFLATRSLNDTPRWPMAQGDVRSEEHTYELQSLMRTSYAVFCFKKKL